MAGFNIKDMELPVAVDLSNTILVDTFAVVAGFNIKDLDLPVAVDLSSTI